MLETLLTVEVYLAVEWPPYGCGGNPIVWDILKPGWTKLMNMHAMTA